MTKFDDLSVALAGLEASVAALLARAAAYVAAQSGSLTPTQAQAVQDRIAAVQTSTDAATATIPTP